MKATSDGKTPTRSIMKPAQNTDSIGNDETAGGIIVNENAEQSDEVQTVVKMNVDGSAAVTPCTRPLQSQNSTATIQRETWGKKAEFLLAVIGFAVDLGNVWRFPYICYQNGGGAFLIPYVIMLIFGGLPLFYMELALGQYHRSGCLTLWKRICPILKGVGYAICVIDLYMAMYYNTIICWALYYLLASFTDELPWTTCDNSWNSEDCLSISNVTKHINLTTGLALSNHTVSPAQEYFDRQVLRMHEADGIGKIGPIKWNLALCLMGVFLLVYFSLWKGVKSSGKAVWFTAIVPYVVLFILFFRGITLPGAMDGIRFYLTPEWEKLKEVKVWTDAASQIFFSLGPGFGTLLALSSYNKFHNNCYRDAILTSSVNCLTSFLAGFVIFSVLGYMAHVQQKEVKDVGKEGPGLVFVVYPEAIAMMTGSVGWSIVFFLMLITLGIDSTFGGLEALITGLCDEYPHLLGRNREWFVFGLLVFIYVCALPTVTSGGIYVVDLLNAYGPSIAILFVVFVEAAGVCWLYGVERFSEDIRKMTGFRPGIFWRACWMFISPVFIFFIFIMTLWNHEPLTRDSYVFPDWSIAIGWVLTTSSLMWIPIFMVYKLIITPGTFMERIRKSVTPERPPANERLPLKAANSVVSCGTSLSQL